MFSRHVLASSYNNFHNATANSSITEEVKGKHSVKKLQGAYQNRAGLEVPATFRLDSNFVSDSQQMRQLDIMNNNIIVFTAHEAEMVQDAPNPNVSSPSRAPLRPTNTQLPANPALVEVKPQDRLLKTENGYLAPFEVSENIPQFPFVAEVKRERSPHSNGPISSETRGEDAGFSQQPVGPNGFQPPVNACTLASSSPVKQEIVTTDNPVAEAAPSLATPAPKQPSINDRVQNLYPMEAQRS
ncbi:hypothetical protein ONS95_007690 [Cadophora gregata]|uniref:uncharacterized protein n=1 Tax=Cadophora gregata TaxID=51156 RepID=UPI0026DC4593|nr:uncharacterized protein ONS95_007690 [Cadophora gregata]KAK0118811.1 hypothetical protein ONS96_011893 [Cadophora gregata f. sp. sojae]KAK0126070.1 hypothetical protein ONS95_007690 [Cadophora gregata]